MKEVRKRCLHCWRTTGFEDSVCNICRARLRRQEQIAKDERRIKKLEAEVEQLRSRNTVLRAQIRKILAQGD